MMSTEQAAIPVDPVIEAFKADIDRSVLRENLKLTVEERFRKLAELQRLAADLRRAGKRPRFISP